MADRIQFELVSPEKRLLSEQVEMVTLPGIDGDLGVLAGHAPLITALRPGVISISEHDSVVERIFTSGGFTEIRPDRLIVLAEQATPVADLNRAEVEHQALTLAASLSNTQDESERERLTAALVIAEAKLASCPGAVAEK